MSRMFKQYLMRTTVFAVLATTGLFSCKKKHHDDAGTSSNAGTTVVSGEITSNQHWTADQHILLQGYVYVTDGVTLTIDPGTIIKGDKSSKGSLIVERGAKLIAIGTSTNPIIFTSNQPAGTRTYGDWGGVILCGKAPNNWIAAPKTDGTTGNLPLGTGQVEGGPRSLYGGSDATDNSGTLSYVRIEFGGVAFSPNNEINGLTLCSVGSGTQIDHIQVSYSGDDSYEWFGGNVNCNHLVCHKGWDDDFDTDNGFSGMVQFGMIYRDPYSADQSGSHSFESDSRNENSTALPLTKVVFSNITAVGPLSNPNFNGYNPNFVCAAIARRSSSMSIFNSLLIGYPLGLIIDEDPTYGSTYANITGGTLSFANNAVIGCPSVTSPPGPVVFASAIARLNDPHSSPNSVNALTQDTSAWTTTPKTPYKWFMSSANSVGASEGISSRLLNAFNGTNPSFLPSSTSYVVYNNNNLPAYMTGDPFSNGKKWPFDPTKAINTDTTNKFANFNAPGFVPSFSDSKLTGATQVRYVGAFTSGDTWTSGWTNFDPVNANYGGAY
ncbi:MAG TPA: hypothetical protein VNB90_01835 [Cytophagaceae bacterium]|nr:hypothetical protein [Cytophagaceae bacterium]